MLRKKPPYGEHNKILLFLTLLFLTGCVTSPGEDLPNTERSVKNCDALQGVFKNASELVDGTIFGRRYLQCGEHCTKKVTGDTSFAFKYDDGKMHWAIIHAPSQDAIDKGTADFQCSRGMLSSKKTFQARDFFGKTSSEKFLFIDTKDQLAGFMKTADRGVFIGGVIPIPVLESEYFLAKPFPPDLRLQAGIDHLLSQEVNTIYADKYSQAIESARAKKIAREQWLNQQYYTSAELYKDKPVEIEGISFTLKAVKKPKKNPKYYYQATVIASKGGINKTVIIQATARHKAIYKTVFDKEIGLGFTMHEPQMANVNILHQAYNQ